MRHVAYLFLIFFTCVTLATISSTTHRADYTGTAAAHVYAYPYRIFSNTDLVVTVRDTDNVETTLVLTTDYTVSNVGNRAGGNVTLVNNSQAWLTSGNLKDDYHLTISRVRPLTQSTDIKNQGQFYPESHENSFDHFIMIDQQLQDQVDRSVKLPISIDPALFDTKLPATVLDGSKIIGVNSTGDALQLYDTSDFTGADGATGPQGAAGSGSGATVIASGVHEGSWILQNAEWTGSVFNRLDISKPAYALNLTNLEVLDSDTAGGGRFLYAAAGANPISDTYGESGGWELISGHSGNLNLEVGGYGITLSGIGGAGYDPDYPLPTRFVNSYQNGGFVGFTSNMLADFSGPDHSDYVASFAGVYQGSSLAFVHWPAGTYGAVDQVVDFQADQYGEATARKGFHTANRYEFGAKQGTSANFGAFIDGELSGTEYIGLTKHVGNIDITDATTLFDITNDAKPSWFMGFKGDSFVVQRAPAASDNYADMVDVFKIDSAGVLTTPLSSTASEITTTYNASGTFNVPVGVTSIDVLACGGGGPGGGGGSTAGGSGGGGGGGAPVIETHLVVVAEDALTITIPAAVAGGAAGVAGANGAATTITGTSVDFYAPGGGGGGGGAGGAGTGADSGLTTEFGGVGGTSTGVAGGGGGGGMNGSTGGVPVGASTKAGYGQGGGAGGLGDQTAGSGGSGADGGAGGKSPYVSTAPTAGSGHATDQGGGGGGAGGSSYGAGGAGGNGANTPVAGTAAAANTCAGGGGGGGSSDSGAGATGGAGGKGKVIIRYTAGT